MDRSTRYYSDEINDDFSGVVRNTVTIDHTYVYRPKNIIWNAAAILVYRLAEPLAWLFLKIVFDFRIVNRRVLKQAGREGYFLYANHTQIPGDGLMPSMITFPRRCGVVVHADNVSLPGTQNVMKMLGAIPLPNQISGMRNFTAYMEKLLGWSWCIVFYPEAHIWPYYTGIRNFKADSFRFPVTYEKKTFCFTVTYQKKRWSKKPRITAYVDGPFLPDSSLPRKEAIQDLRNRIYETMVERSKNSNYEYIAYRHASEKLNGN